MNLRGVVAGTMTMAQPRYDGWPSGLEMYGDPHARAALDQLAAQHQDPRVQGHQDQVNPGQQNPHIGNVTYHVTQDQSL